MRESIARRSAQAAFLPAIFLGLACSSTSTQPTGSAGRGGSSAASTTTTSAGGSGGAAEDAGVDAPPPPPSACIALALPERAFSAGPYGTHRRDTADDFTLDLLGEDPWHFKERWSGCESYIFIPDVLAVSGLDKTSIWEQGITKLIAASPKNTHYFFVSRSSSDDKAKANTEAMRARIDADLAKLTADKSEPWKTRLHVVAQRAGSLGSWVGDVLGGLGQGGFTIDRAQRVRGMGNFADVKQYSQPLSDAGHWPWKANLAYASHEARFFNWEAEQEAAHAADQATVVPFWTGETLAELAEKDVDLPPAAEMAKFDTLEVEVWSGCPDADKPEFGNCGAWDYIAALAVLDPATMKNLEIARFITSYHRETHWVVDISPMLALLQSGGKRHFRWDFAPSWNTQPTATQLSLRFSNKNKGYRPVEAVYLWPGGNFDATYAAAHPPVQLPIAADAKRVELWAIVSGHGGGTNNCAEFCNHQHEFKVNGTPFLKEHKEAGTSDKCIAHVDHRMIPNQGGTWWTGRGGWCPGQQVEPWSADVTANANAGDMAALEYTGLYKLAVPPDGSGNIDLASYLIIYK
ncbi:MAG: peptide-N-glycosidase F-related protein [Byssovorax sp.]